MGISGFSSGGIADRTRSDPFLLRMMPFALIFLVFATLLSVFQYRGELAESDLYRTLLGLLSGYANGQGLGDLLHYGRSFGFGYIELIYSLAGPDSLNDRDALITVINNVGYVSALAALAGIMASVWMVYGEKTAVIAGIVFGFSPIMLSIGASGHQLLPALAFFGGASVAFLSEPKGWRRLAAYAAGAILLFVGLTMRAELPLAFPWLVLAQRTPVDFGRFLKTALQRSLACLVAFGAFLALRHQILAALPEDGGSMGNLGDLVATFYRLENIIPGLIGVVLSCGLVTAAVAGAAIVAEAVSIFRRRPGLRALWLGHAYLLAPLSVILCGLVFWLPNPYPARHFTFVLLGFAILIGAVCVRMVRTSTLGAVVIGLAIVLGNQIAAEVLHPVVMARLASPYTNFPDTRRTLTAAPLGFFWRHAAEMKHRREVFTAYSRRLEATCEPKLLVLSDQAHHMASYLFHKGSAVATAPVRIGTYEGIEVSRPGRSAIYLSLHENWPTDAVALMLQNEALRDYKIAFDPYSRSIYDQTPIPQDRRADVEAEAAGPGCP